MNEQLFDVLQNPRAIWKERREDDEGYTYKSNRSRAELEFINAVRKDFGFEAIDE